MRPIIRGSNEVPSTFAASSKNAISAMDPCQQGKVLIRIDGVVVTKLILTKKHIKVCFLLSLIDYTRQIMGFYIRNGAC